MWQSELTGRFFHDIALTYNYRDISVGKDGRVYVFGAMASYITIDALDIDTGEEVLVFNSEYVPIPRRRGAAVDEAPLPEEK